MSRPSTGTRADPNWKKGTLVHPLLAARFAFHLKKHRAERKLTLEACGEKLGITNAYVHMLESCQRTPSLEIVERAAKAFGLDPAAMLEDPK